MAEHLLKPKGRVTGATRRNAERTALQATLADLARAGSQDPVPDRPADDAPGLTGHEALAALVAEVAQASALSPADADPRPRGPETGPGEPDATLSPAPVTRAPRRRTPLRAGGRPSPAILGRAPTALADDDDDGLDFTPTLARGADDDRGSTTAVVRSLTALEDGAPGPAPARPLTKPTKLSGPVELVPPLDLAGSSRSAQGSSSAAPTTERPPMADQPTIPLRRRASNHGPASTSPDDGVGAVEAAPGPSEAAAAGRAAGAGVVAWLPSDDDILPRRQMRRGRSFRRAR